VLVRRVGWWPLAFLTVLCFLPLAMVSKAATMLTADTSDVSDDVAAAVLGAPPRSAVAAGTASHQSKTLLYKVDATIGELFGTLEGALLWAAIKDAYQVCYCPWFLCGSAPLVAHAL
jgi:hypothetical protein